MKEKMKLLHETLGISYNDVEAMLTGLAEVRTTDDIPLQELRKFTRVDSGPETLNKELGLTRDIYKR